MIQSDMSKILEKLEKKLPSYVDEIINIKTSESAKLDSFKFFIHEIFDIDSVDIDSEVSTTSNILNLRGRIDTLVGNVILEFKKDLSTGLDVAKEELFKYFQSNKEKFPSNNYVGIASDGIQFRVFYPKFENENLIEIKEISSLDLKNSTPVEVMDWFDSFFFSQDKIIPTSKNIIHRFGRPSVTFRSSLKHLDSLFHKLEKMQYSPALMRYNNWENFLEIVYGDKPEKSRELFLRHTFLSIFVKFLIHEKMSGVKKTSPSISKIIYGDYFKKNAGIQNFIEEDFFVWPMSKPIESEANKIFEPLLKSISKFDLTHIDEDVLKSLYQHMVSPEVRQNLGEFYTPDWLAEDLVKRGLDDNPEKTVLDPSCGSGTFLFKTIQYKKNFLIKQGWSKPKILEHILQTVSGLDIHPLAVLISKTNYLLALEDLVYSKENAIIVPVYLSDSLKIPSKTVNLDYSIETYAYHAVSDSFFYFPLSIISNPQYFDKLIELMNSISKQFSIIFEKNKTTYPKRDGPFQKNIDSAFNLLSETHFLKSVNSEKINLTDEESEILIKNIKTLFKLIINEQDSIWPYVIRNMYKPLLLSNNKIDLIIGNPPWLGLNKIVNPNYQDFVKQKSKEYGLDIKKKRSQTSSLNLAPLFFCHCSDNYLADSGSIIFVLPESILSASQNVSFLKFEKPQADLKLIYELTDVKPLFRIPSCVLFAKKNSPTKYPVRVIKFSTEGSLDSSNEPLSKASQKLVVKKSLFSPVKRLSIISKYAKLFAQGATIYPHAFWLVDLEILSNMGINPNCPAIKKAHNPDAKMPWKNFSLEGNVEQNFFFTTLLSKNLVPFGYSKRSLIVLPVLLDDQNVSMIKDSQNTEILGTNFSHYLKEAEIVWKDNAGAKSAKMSIYDRINYNDNCTSQKPKSGYTVLYTKSATNIASCVVDNSENYVFEYGEHRFNVKGFFAEGTTYFYNTSSKHEAYYLCAIFNSNELNEKIKPLQTKGTFGPRDIHQTVFQFNIPLYDSKNKSHNKLSEIAMDCNKKINKVLENTTKKSSAGVRGEIRTHLKSEMGSIDKMVKLLLNFS